MPNPIQTVVVTGAAGGVGTMLRKLLKGVYPNTRWSDIKTPPDLAPDEVFVRADLTEMAALERLLDGAQGVVHRWLFGRGAVGHDFAGQHYRLP